MTGEPIKTLKLSVDPHPRADALESAAPIIDEFLSQLNSTERQAIMEQIGATVSLSEVTITPVSSK